MSVRRIGAIFRKELREYARNRSIVATMTVLPLVFTIAPLVSIFNLRGDASEGLRHVHILIGLLGIAAVVPAVVASYAVVGERQQGSLEPVLTTPIPGREFLVAKALAALLPSLGIAYAVYAFALALIALFAQPDVASALFQPGDIVTQVLFTPLIAGWSIWVGIAISSRVTDLRVSQQVGTLASVPTALIAELIGFDVIHPDLTLAVAVAVLLVALNVLGWRLTTALFNRERLIAGSR
jgi:ABC-2 type transport system permease protein